MRSRLALVAAALAALGGAAPARAERLAVVVVAAADPPVTVGELAEAMTAALRARGDVVIDAPTEARARLAAGAVPVARLAELGRAARLADEGWQAYLAVRPDFAAARLAEARTAGLAAVDLAGGPALLAEISLRLGAVELALGRAAEAARDFRLAAVLAPGRAVSDAEFKPAVVGAFEAARAGPGPSISVALAVEPVGATIELDGRPLGAAPRELVLEPGLHVVVARAAGYLARGEVVDGADGPARIQLEVDVDAAALTGPRLIAVGDGAPATRRALEALIVYAELDGIWLVAPVWQRGAAGLIGQYCGGLPARCTPIAELSVPRVAQLGAAIRTLVAGRRTGRTRPASLASDARLARGEARPGAGTVRSPWRSPWLYAGAAAVMVGVALAVVLAGDEIVEPVIGVDPGDFGGP